jgi:hypothetical protein
VRGLDVMCCPHGRSNRGKATARSEEETCFGVCRSLSAHSAARSTSGLSETGRRRYLRASRDATRRPIPPAGGGGTCVGFEVRRAGATQEIFASLKDGFRSFAIMQFGFVNLPFSDIAILLQCLFTIFLLILGFSPPDLTKMPLCLWCLIHTHTQLLGRPGTHDSRTDRRTRRRTPGPRVPAVEEPAAGAVPPGAQGEGVRAPGIRCRPYQVSSPVLLHPQTPARARVPAPSRAPVPTLPLPPHLPHLPAPPCAPVPKPPHPCPNTAASPVH